LHLGHLAKSFALREAPANIRGAGAAGAAAGGKGKRSGSGKGDHRSGDVAEKMRKAVRKQDGVRAAAEFQIADTKGL